MVLLCPLCPAHFERNLRMLLKHIRLMHADTPNFSIQCTFQGCRVSFRTFYTYRNHVYAFHSNYRGEDSFDPREEGEDDDYDGSEDSSSDEDNDGKEDSSAPSPPGGIRRAAAMWILKVREKYLIPQGTIETVTQDIDTLYEVALDNLRYAVRKKLIEGGINPDDFEMDDVFDRCGPHGRLFRGLETHHKQQKYCKENFKYVEPQVVVLGTRMKSVGTGCKRRLIEKEDRMMYIPLLETLQVVLQNENVIAEIQNGHFNQYGVMSDYCDAEEFKKHPLFSKKPHALQLILYYDDIEVCNALGSRRTKHKLGIFYYMLGNISPKYRSRVNSIQLLGIVKTKDLKTYSMNTVLSPVVADIIKLEKGFQFDINGYSQVYYGTISTVCADNLGQSCIGGFKEGSTAFRGCRQCMATREEFKSVFKEDELQLRSLNKHKKQCRKLSNLKANDPDLFKKKSKKYGINSETPLLKLQYFNLCSGSLVPDVMHDVLEGVLEYETKLLLRYCIDEKKYFTSTELQDWMEGFELGYMETPNRPTPITREILRKKDNSLNQNASQMWLLGRIIPAMIGHLVPEEDERWMNLTLLLRILQLLLAHSVTVDECVYLKVLIEDHHNAFAQLYPNSSVTPKMHYMVHMPRIMMQFGPLVRHWTMRFEARHLYFKKLANSLGNFKNICLSLASRYQQLQCYVNINDSAIGESSLEFGPSSIPDTQILREPCFNGSHDVKSVPWVKLNGIVYKKPCAVVITIANEIMPVFGDLQAIYIIRDEVYLQLKTLETLYYSEHFNAYVVLDQSTASTIILPLNDLLSYVPLYARKIKGLTKQHQKAIILKHSIFH